MRYFALAADYDGTLARDGTVDETTLASLERVRKSGRKLILVTGREWDDLRAVFPRVDLFDAIVAENGALLVVPATRQETLLAKPLPEEFSATLQLRGVAPLRTGRVIVATWVPHELAVLEVIRDLRLDAQVIFNKGPVMVLPAGINKATGLQAALTRLDLSAHNVVGIGDAENDYAFLEVCECSAAVSNALPRVKAAVDYICRREHGAGVSELIEQLVESDLQALEPALARHELVLGTAADGRELRVKPYGWNVLLTGSMGSGKSTLATAFLEQLAVQHYQFCVLDPEGDYGEFQAAVMLGAPKRPPLVEEVIELLRRADGNLVVNLVGLPLEQRPKFIERLHPALSDLRVGFGRPHWLIVDETHHLVPTDWGTASHLAPERLRGVMLITAYPARVAQVLLPTMNLIVAVGESAGPALQAVANLLDEPLPAAITASPAANAVLAWQRAPAGGLFWCDPQVPETIRLRHQRQHLEGELTPELSFYFRGAEGGLNLRAANLTVFLQLGEGIGDEDWLYHLRRHDYSRWFRDVLQDEKLVTATEALESEPGISAKDSRDRMRNLIETRYKGKLPGAALPRHTPNGDQREGSNHNLGAAGAQGAECSA